MKRLLLVLLTAALCAAPLAACSPTGEQENQPAQVIKYENQNESPTDGGTLRLCLFETDSLNPLITQNTENIQTLKLIYDSLFIVGQDLAFTPNLCESYTVSEDGLTYELRIRSDVHFHDGSLLTAADVEFSLRLLFEAESPYASKLSDIASYRADGRLLRLVLKQPTANLPALLDFPVVSAHCAEDVKGAIRNKAEYVPNGTGLYQVQSYRKNKELLLSPYPSHHLGRLPHIEAIHIDLLYDRAAAISMLENLGVDLLSSDVIDPNEYTPKRTVSSVDYATNQFTYLGFNHEVPALKGAATRRAISAAIDRSKLVQEVLNGRADACDLPIRSSSWLYKKDLAPLAFDPEQAKSLLKEDGWEDTDSNGTLERAGENGSEQLSLELLVNEENAQRIRVAAQLKRWLDDIGVSVTVTQLPFTEYTQRLDQGRFDMALCEVDISDNCDLKFLLGSGRCICRIANESIDDLLRQADCSATPAQTQNVYWTLCAFLRQETPVAGLYFKNDTVIFSPLLRGNICPTGSSLYGNICEWFLKEG